jgi:Putative zinc-finger
MVNDGNRETVNCEQVWRELSNYLEGDVETGLRAAMDDHLRTCRSCTSMLAGARNVIRLYSDERMIEVPAGFARRLEKRLIRAARVRGGEWSTWSAWLVPVAALILFAGGLRFASSSTVPHPMLSAMGQPAHGIPPDMVVVVTAGAKEFHRPGCGVIHHQATARTLTAKEAIEQGYVPCPRCLRNYLEVVAGRKVEETESQAELDVDPEDRPPSTLLKDAERHGQ